MVSKRHVEIGRVALINYGEDYGKLVVIVDVLDQNWALVDSPDVVCCKMNFKRLLLTDIKIDIKRAPKKEELFAAMEAADVKNKLGNSSWGRKLTVQMKRVAKRYQVLIRCPDQKLSAKSVLVEALPSSGITLRDLVVTAFPDSGKNLSLVSFNLNGKIVDGASKMSEVKITPLSTLNLTFRLLGGGGGKDGASTSAAGNLERPGVSVVGDNVVTSVYGTEGNLERPESSVVGDNVVTSVNGMEGLPRLSGGSITRDEGGKIVAIKGPEGDLRTNGLNKYVVNTEYGDQVVTVYRKSMAVGDYEGKKLPPNYFPGISVSPLHSQAFRSLLAKNEK